MIRGGLWHPELIGELAALGHGDLVVIADAGLPVSRASVVIDLLWAPGEPPLLPVLRAVLREGIFESATLASALIDDTYGASVLGELEGLDVAYVHHEELKALTLSARTVIRTGEATPYANVVLRAGVAF